MITVCLYEGDVKIGEVLRQEPVEVGEVVDCYVERVSGNELSLEPVKCRVLSSYFSFNKERQVVSVLVYLGFCCSSREVRTAESGGRVTRKLPDD